MINLKTGLKGFAKKKDKNLKSWRQSLNLYQTNILIWVLTTLGKRTGSILGKGEMFPTLIIRDLKLICTTLELIIY